MFYYLVLLLILLLFSQYNVDALSCSDVDSNGNLYVPNTVTSIAANALKDCNSLTGIVSFEYGAQVESIEEFAFQNSSLTTINDTCICG